MSQQGSILAGVIGLGLAMTVAGAGFILMAGNLGRDSGQALEKQKSFRAAESGVMLGLQWVREKIAVTGSGIIDSLDLTPGLDPFIYERRVAIKIYKTVVPNRWTLKARAFDADGGNFAGVAFDATILTSPLSPALATFTLQNWRLLPNP